MFVGIRKRLVLFYNMTLVVLWRKHRRQCHPTSNGTNPALNAYASISMDWDSIKINWQQWQETAMGPTFTKPNQLGCFCRIRQILITAMLPNILFFLLSSFANIYSHPRKTNLIIGLQICKKKNDPTTLLHVSLCTTRAESRIICIKIIFYLMNNSVIEFE